MDDLYRDTFSSPYIILRYLGNWPYDWGDPVKNKLFTFYRLISTMYEFHVVLIGWVDLYLNLNNLKRMIYNLCVTFFTTTLSVKNLIFLRKSSAVNRLRLKLFRYTLTYDDEDMQILNKYRYVLRFWKWIFYICTFLFAPLWWVSSLMSLKGYPRELPFPVWSPLDLEDNYQFAFGFCYHALSAMIFVLRAVHAELCMYSLILQTTGLYRILGKNLMKIDEFYRNDDCEIDCKGERKQDINKFLTEVRVKKELKTILRRQMELKECVREIEYFLHLPVLIELFGGLLLSVINGFELIEATMEFSYKLSYQIGYTIVVLTDLYVWCLFADRLMEESKNFNTLLYNLKWYEMEHDTKKDLMLMIVGAQRIDRLTVGKFFTLNLSTYLGIIKNLYSWLTVFRTVTQKK